MSIGEQLYIMPLPVLHILPLTHNTGPKSFADEAPGVEVAASSRQTHEVAAPTSSTVTHYKIQNGTFLSSNSHHRTQTLLPLALCIFEANILSTCRFYPS
ncbi:hypothetical protein I7I48_00257 [Histoplasma ohiense]|nr:hypothetical protein I7I48_00257 [Histoplasma ohiense (nom. inval.)]